MNKNPLLKPTIKVPSDDKEGRIGRATNRAKRQRKIQTETIDLIQRFLPGITFLPIDQSDYSENLNILINEIEKKFTAPADKAIAINFVATVIDMGNKVGYWSLEPPERIIKIRRHRQMRNLKWFHYTRDCAVFFRQFEKAFLESDSIESLNKQELGILIVISACLYGGLNDEKALSQLCVELDKESFSLKRMSLAENDYVWVDLIYLDKAISNLRIHNENDEINELRLKRWFVDTWSLGLMNRYFQYKKQHKNNVENESLINRIKQLLEKNKIDFPFNSLKRFATTGISVSESMNSVNLSSALVETANNRNISVSLPEEYWAAISVVNKTELPEVEFNDYKTFQIPKNNRKNSTSNQVSSSKIYQQIKSALAIKQENKKKTTREMAISILDGIDTSQWNVSEQCLIEWYQSLLIERGLKVSSVNRYHIEISKVWLSYGKINNFYDFDADKLLLSYKTMIQEKQSDKGRNYRAGRLQELHEYAERNFNFPILAENIYSGDKVTPFVRAGYITYSTYQQLLSSILMIKDLDENSRQSIIVLVIIAYRTGMRLQEILKLRLCEVEASENYWLRIKSNPFGDNKRNASLRKLPVSVLFTKNEAEIWEHYFHHRINIAKNDTDLVFCQDDNGSFPWDARIISKLISDLLRKITSIYTMVFHHLRHSALSNLQLIAERQFDLVDLFMGYEKKQAQKIHQVIFGKNETLRIYWGLASFAGHNCPDVTLGSYLHFCEFITHRKLTENQEKISYQKAKNISYLSGNKITRIVGFDNINEFGIEKLRPFILEKINRNCEWIGEKNRTNTEIQYFEDERLSLKEKISAESAWSILSDLEDGGDITLTSYKYNVPEAKIKQWMQKSKLLAEIKTRKKHKRLVSTQRLKTNKESFLPAQPKSAIEKNEVSQIIRQLRNDYINNQDEINWVVNYYIANSTSSSAGVRFTNKMELARFKKALAGAIDEKKWYQTKKNQSIYLHLRHPTEKKYLQKDERRVKYSSTSLRYLLHMLGILI